MLPRLRNALSSPAAPLLLAAFAALLSLPSLWFGLQTDDHMHAVGFARDGGPLQMLQISPETLALRKDQGGFSWWSSPNLVVRFLRPLSSLTHWIEFSYWPSAPWAMHLINIAIYAALVAVATVTYRELLGAGPVAPLAALMFAIDGNHAVSVGWISSRNTVLATLFALLALLFHVRSRARAHLGLALTSVACTALALLSAEFGVAVFAYLGAYALVLDSGTRKARWRALIPHALVGLAWAALYAKGGYGFRNAGWYRDPLADPWSTIGQGLGDLPLWLVSQLGMNLGEFLVPFDATIGRVLGLALLPLLLTWLLPVLRGSRGAQFFALGMALSLPPLFTTYPQGRLLIAASFGGLGWIACALGPLAESTPRFARAGARILRALHVKLAPFVFVIMLGQLVGIERAAQALADALPKEGGREVILVNPPFELLNQIAWQIRGESGQPMLSSFHQLYAGGSSLSIDRIDDRTLDVSASRGWGHVPFERLFSARQDMPTLGSSRTVRNLRATVMEVNAEGLPARVRFQFPSSLDSPNRTWLIWRGKRPAPFAPPPRGGRVHLAPVSILALDAFSE